MPHVVKYTPIFSVLQDADCSVLYYSVVRSYLDPMVQYFASCFGIRLHMCLLCGV